MKIRIKGDSIRFRLTKPEVKALCSLGHFKDETHTASGTFTYAVVKSPKAGMRAGFADNTITLYVNEELLKGWDINDTVGFEDVEKTGKQASLHLLLEKDFVCLDQRLEDQSDNYPNPKLKKEGDAV